MRSRRSDSRIGGFDAPLGLASLQIDEDLAEIPLRERPRPRPVDVPARQEDRLAQTVEHAGLLAAEATHPVLGQSQPAHHVVDPFRSESAAIAPVLLLDVKAVLQSDESLFEQPDVEVDIPLDRAEAVVAHEQERCIGRELLLDGPHAAVERLPERDEPGTQRLELFLPTVGRPVGQVPDVPELVTQPIRGHQVEDQQIPIAPVHQELDRPEVLVQERGQVVDDRGLVAPVVDGRGPGPIRTDNLFQLGVNGGVGGEIGRPLGAEKVAQVEAGKSFAGRGG